MFKTISSLLSQRKQSKKNRAVSPQSPANKEKPNKFEPISAEPFLKLAKISPSKAAQQIRERYDELSDYTNPSAMPCLHWQNIEGWNELAKAVSADDPILAKTIYSQLLQVRNFLDPDHIAESGVIDFDKVSKQLYILENKTPERELKGKLAVLSALVAGSPTMPFWEESLEKAFQLACEFTNPEKEGHIEFIAKAIFYCENSPLLKERFVPEFTSRLNNPNFLIGEPRPAWNRGYFFNRMNGFCFGSRYGNRNRSFPPNSESVLNVILLDTFWRWVKQYSEEESLEVLHLLQHAIHSDDEALSLEATKTYIDIFPPIAKKDPIKANECLRNILRYSGAGFTHSASNEERHQNFNLCRVFDETIVKLRDIDDNAATLVFYEFLMSSHGGPSHKMKNKYASEIGMAHLHRKDKLNSQ